MLPWIRSRPLRDSRPELASAAKKKSWSCLCQVCNYTLSGELSPPAFPFFIFIFLSLLRSPDAFRLRGAALLPAAPLPLTVDAHLLSPWRVGSKYWGERRIRPCLIHNIWGVKLGSLQCLISTQGKNMEVLPHFAFPQTGEHSKAALTVYSFNIYSPDVFLQFFFCIFIQSSRTG